MQIQIEPWYYNQVAVNAFSDILNEAYAKIDGASTKDEVDSLYAYYEKKFSYVLTTFDLEDALNQAMIEIKQYALTSNVSILEETVKVEIDILNKKDLQMNKLNMQ